MLPLTRVNRLASLAILPLMAIALAFAWKMQPQDEPDLAAPTEGTLVVANLRDETLTVIHLGPVPTTRTLAVFGPPHEMVEYQGTLFVTLGRAGAVVKVDPRAPGILAEYEYEQSEPHGLAYDDGQLFVTLDAVNSVAVVGLPEYRQDFEATGDTPHAVASRDGETYITDSRDNALRLLGAPPVVVPTDVLPESVAIAGDFVVTANADGRSLDVFRRRTLQPVARIPLSGRPVRVVALSDTELAIALNDTGKMVLVELGEMKVARTIDTGERPDGICASPSGQYVGVASNADDSVRIYRRSDWRFVTSFPAGDGPGSCLWLP